MGAPDRPGIDDADPTFPWTATREVLESCRDFAFDPATRSFAGTSPAGRPTRVVPPLIQPVPGGVATAADFLAVLPELPGAQLVVLLQAGAAALGWFEGGVAVRTKAIKKYVVRGRGKAQPTHLASKGKSRYGSRLRLQNARALLAEVNQRMQDWYDGFSAPSEVFYSCPVRLWADLLSADPAPPFEPDRRLLKIPLDVPVPTTEVLLRTYRRLGYGRIERAPVDPAQ